MDNIQMPHNQLIINAGNSHTGIIFAPFSSKKPSDITAGDAFTTAAYSPRKAPIGGGSGSGWQDRPDAGGTSLYKEPIGEPLVLFLFALLYSICRTFIRRGHIFLILVLSLITHPVHGAITALTFSPSAADGGQTVTINPTIASLPAGTVYVCWSVYYDAECTHELEGITFSAVPASGANAVSFTAPTAPGTYYIKSALHTGSQCGGLLESYYASPLIIYPSDADIVLRRDAQTAATRVDLTDAASKKAYGAMRFSKSALNDAGTSAYERYNYFISFPFDVQVGDIYGIGTVGTDWRIWYYDGRGRAREGFFADRTDNWVMIDDTDSVLHAGQGYLLQLNSIRLAGTNEAIWANGSDIATLYFPALSPVSGITTRNETIPALGEAYRCSIDLSASLGSEGDRRTKDSYWRCLGVPSWTSPSGVTNLPYLYEWDMSDNSLTVVSSAAFVFQPSHAYLVQNGNAIVWTNVTLPASVAARQRQEATSRELLLEIRQGNVTCDRTFVRLADEAEVTEGFDFGWDLSKELNTGRTNLYSLVGYERLAANVLPDTVKRVPLGVQAGQAGTYVFTMPQGISGMKVTLVDHEKHTRTDMPTNEYTVSLENGSYEGRFELVFGEDTPTDIRVLKEETEERSVRKMLIDGILYIEKNGKRYSLY